MLAGIFICSEMRRLHGERFSWEWEMPSASRRQWETQQLQLVLGRWKSHALPPDPAWQDRGRVMGRCRWASFKLLETQWLFRDITSQGIIPFLESTLSDTNVYWWRAIKGLFPWSQALVWSWTCPWEILMVPSWAVGPPTHMHIDNRILAATDVLTSSQMGGRHWYALVAVLAQPQPCSWTYLGNEDQQKALFSIVSIDHSGCTLPAKCNARQRDPGLLWHQNSPSGATGTPTCIQQHAGVGTAAPSSHSSHFRHVFMALYCDQYQGGENICLFWVQEMKRVLSEVRSCLLLPSWALWQHQHRSVLVLSTMVGSRQSCTRRQPYRSFPATS